MTQPADALPPPHLRRRIKGELGQKEALRRLFPYLWRLRGAIFIGFLFTLLWSGINLGYGKVAKDFLDAVQHSQLRHLDIEALVALVVFTARGFANFGMNFVWQYCTQKLILWLTTDIFEHLSSMPVSFFDTRKTGHLLASIANDAPSAANIVDTVQDGLSDPLILVGGLVLMFVLNWQLALISCISLPPIAWIIGWATRKMRVYQNQVLSYRAQVVDKAQEALSSIRIVKAFGNEQHEAGLFRRCATEVLRSTLRTVRVRLAMRPMVDILTVIAMLLVIWAGGRQIAHQPPTLTFGSLAWFLLVLAQVAGSARSVGGIWVALAQVGVAADRVFTVLNTKSDITDRPGAVALGRAEGRVEFDHVTFAYNEDQTVLNDVSFAIEPGQVVAVVGPTGAGKTTIAALIPRFYDVTGGAVRIDGVDVRDCTIASLRRQIGIVPQDTLLFAATLRENIAYGRLGATRAEVEEAAKLANAWEFIEKLPAGLETRVGERGVSLSGGQRQRIAIARAILRDPRILILDEATASLDSHSEALVQAALQKVTEARTTLVIAHRLSTIRRADRILALRDGRIVEAGTHDELLELGGLYASLYFTQFRHEGELAA